MNSRKKYLLVFAAAYLLSSQAAIVCIMSELLSSSAEHAVAWQSGPIREHATLSWTPRTHLPVNEQTVLPAEVPPTISFYPSAKPRDINRCISDVPARIGSYFSPLSNKAPPRA
jgi:hypothetical protein